MSVKTHLDSAAAYIAVAESGDAKREAYMKAADEILAAQAEDPKLTQVAIGKAIGKSPKWVTDLLGWRPRSEHAPTPWAAYEDDHRYRSAERKVPTRHEDRVEMATKLLADPKVAKTVAAKITDPSTAAGRHIANTVVEREAAARRKQAERAAENRNMGGVPLPALWASMVGKLDEWKRGMAGIPDDSLRELANLEGRGLERVVQEVEGLNDETHRWLDMLGSPRPNLRVIETRAKRSA